MTDLSLQLRAAKVESYLVWHHNAVIIQACLIQNDLSWVNGAHGSLHNADQQEHKNSQYTFNNTVLEEEDDILY